VGGVPFQWARRLSRFDLVVFPFGRANGSPS
jgi:hypothetical protein